MSQSSQEEVDIECPICMEPIENGSNKTVTQCGHAFHSSCIFQNMAAHNGFGCPYCRTTLAEEIESDDDDDDDDDDDVSEYSDDSELEQEREDYILTSFRMFHRIINNEEGNEEEQDNEYVAHIAAQAETAIADEQEKQNKVNFVSEFMISRQITYNDLIKYVISVHSSRYDPNYGMIESKFEAAMNRYEREH